MDGKYSEDGHAVMDDWFIFTFDHNHMLCDASKRGHCEPISYTVHEMCQRMYCRHGIKPECPFHPAGCECSNGACQL